MTEDTWGRGRDGVTGSSYGRRRFIAVGTGVGAALLAGCTSDDGGDGTPTDGGGDGSGGESAAFRLLVSDAPADIDDFDRLDVTLDSARVFEGSDGDDGEEGEGTETEGNDEGQTETEEDSDDEETTTETVEEDHQQTGDAENGTSTENGTATETEADSEDATETEDPEDGEGDRGFYVLDLDDPTVDLTQVVGDKAVAVFDGELSEGSYRKLELNVADVEGIVDGEEVEVKVPSEKLQLTKPFEVRAGEELDFVFDINVVKRGNQASYNLKPVISQSGVRGKDVEVEEVGDESGRGESEHEGEDEGAEDADGSEGGNGTDDTDTETDGEEGSDDGGADAGDETDGTAGNESSA